MTSKIVYTLISRYVAKPNYSFEFRGVAGDCRSCRNLKACAGRLEEGEIYSVVKVRKNRLDCPLIGEEAVVVQVRPSRRLLAVSSRSAVEGTTLTVQGGDGLPCGEECLCLPRDVRVGRRYVVRRIVKKTFDCPFESSRSLVEVEPV